MPSIASVAAFVLLAISASVSATPVIRAACPNNGTPNFSGQNVQMTDLNGKTFLASDGKTAQFFLIQNDGKFPGAFIIKNAGATANGLTVDSAGATSFTTLVNGNSGVGQSWKIVCEECTVDSKTPASKCTVKPNGKDTCLTTGANNKLVVETCSADATAKKGQTFNFATK
ncbi:hypothetical protein VNI00_013990 [Paramarasmius palmivorus]|uniref:Uncharacterized protein n=1 Tax=Paramarasmius palmivorus TaxID=297713 RepID=A0AAW0BUN4_9AGAR